jgi:UDP-N-acetylmuramyl pentapeptide synthase
MNKRTTLLLAAAEALEAGEDPFSAAFLGGHNVTSNECAALALQLALGARAVAQGLDNPRSPLGMEILMVLAGDYGEEE